MPPILIRFLELVTDYFVSILNGERRDPNFFYLQEFWVGHRYRKLVRLELMLMLYLDAFWCRGLPFLARARPPRGA
jgi:hypothetical protein